MLTRDDRSTLATGAVIRTTTDRVSAEDAWRAVEASVGDDVPPFCRWDWTGRWVTHFAGMLPYQFWIVERHGAPIGALLVTRSTEVQGPLTIRQLNLGTSGEPDGEGVFVEYNGVCAADGQRELVARAVLEHAHRRPGWDELLLNGFDPRHAAPFLSAEPSMTARSAASPFWDLAGSDGDLIDAIASKSVRSLLRRSLRGIEPYETVWATDGDTALEMLDELRLLHQTRWEAEGEHGAFGSQRQLGFHRDLVRAWVPEGRAAVFAVRSRGRIIAALYGYVDGDTFQFVQSGLQPSDHPKVRVGYAAHLLMARAARERGLRCYEFLVGDHRYKSELSSGERSLVWARLVNRRPRGLAITAARAAKRAARRAGTRLRSGEPG